MGNFYLLSAEEQREASFRRLVNYIRDVIYPYHPYYRKLFDEKGIDQSKIRKPEDLARIPLTYKVDYREDPISFILQPTFPGQEARYDTARIGGKFVAKYFLQSIFNYPRDYAAQYRANFKEPFRYLKIGRRAALEWMPIHFHASAGSTGDPTPATYTYRDLHLNVKETASAIYCGREVKWNLRGFNIFPGAPHLAFFQVIMGKWLGGCSGFDTFGGSVISTDRQIQLFSEGGFDSIIAIPSYLVYWLRRAVEMVKAGEVEPLSSLFIALTAAEPLTDSLRRHIKELVLAAGGREDFHLVQGYGMTEMKIAFYECTDRSQIHLNPKYFYWEVVDPETGEHVPEGEPGVLVFSHIDWRGTSFLRYYTGDLIAGGVRWERCGNCGLTYPIMYPPIMRAKKDFTKLKGTRVALLDLVTSVRDTPGVYQFQVTLDKEVEGDEFSRDRLVVRLAIDDGYQAQSVVSEVKTNVKKVTEVTPDEIVIEHDREKLELDLFERTGIKADYVIENRPVHL
ncbi:MAG: AMP-binding protein [Actinobacteria bacterium]|nr:AMP-binding protein [Actinomycetota bacterium]